MSKFSKRILAFILTVCLILQLMPNQLTVYAASEPQYYGWTASGDPNLHNPQANLIWNGCFIYSAAMLMTANGISHSTPYDLYLHLGGNGSNTPGFTWDKISPHYSFNKYSGNLTGSYDNKLQTVERLVKEHSQGIILSINNNAVNFVSPFDGKSHTQQHCIYVYYFNGQIKVHDPYYGSLKSTSISKMFAPLDAFNGYCYITNNAPTPSFTFDDKGVGGARGSVSETNAVIYEASGIMVGN